MDTLVDYTNPVLDQYRHYTHDAILIYGFIPEKTSSGAIKARFTIEDGIRSVNSSDHLSSKLDFRQKNENLNQMDHMI